MKKLLSGSFRRRLFVAFLTVSLVPLMLCSAMLLQIFRLRLADSAQSQAETSLHSVSHSLDTLYEGLLRTTSALEEDPLVSAALSGEKTERTQIYSRLFGATEGLRDYARFDLCDLEGAGRYSTQSGLVQMNLPTNWGVLQQARDGGPLEFVACEDITDATQPLLQGAAILKGADGKPAGFLVISLYQNHLRRLLEGVYGVQNDLMLFSRYWRPVYCAQASLAETLGPELRSRVLAGQPLDGAAEGFLYTVEYHQNMELYLVLQRPQSMTRDTTILLYTVAAGSALFCLGISVLMSLKLSRQMFRPIQRLQSAIGEVEHNNLDVCVPTTQNDELGQLARRFNEMLVALKHNQQELVENQRELNQAQIRMLQAQLNPHFLCNTLDTMKWISKINQVPQVALMSTNLADILRFCISPEEFVPLRREVQILERYIEIQKIRLSGAFAFEADVPLELEDSMVPKMILQPIVENAILHGLEGAESGTVRVSARRTEKGFLQITVSDNGKGLPPDMEGAYSHRGRELSRGHLGLYNVDTILRKYYGADFGLYLSAGPGGRGAEISATLPLHKEESEC